ncbi:MAG TPA: cyclase family protein [Propionibacteriaceae bacterium]|nr:cyclase family protein [Propionibacteriaceae bacterium]
MARYVDVTVPLAPGRVPLYPGDTALEVTRAQARAEGESANVSKLVCSLHCGTHVDGPAHFFDGESGVDAVAVEALIGPAWVADATSATPMLDAATLSQLDIPAGTTRVLFKTTNSAIWDAPSFVEDFVAVTADGAAALVERGVRTVGIDYLSIAPYRDPAPTHEVLLRAGVAIIETLDLRSVEPGAWHLTCLPLRIPGADGAPARALLSR